MSLEPKIVLLFKLEIKKKLQIGKMSIRLRKINIAH